MENVSCFSIDTSSWHSHLVTLLAVVHICGYLSVYGRLARWAIRFDYNKPQHQKKRANTMVCKIFYPTLASSSLLHPVLASSGQRLNKHKLTAAQICISDNESYISNGPHTRTIIECLCDMFIECCVKCINLQHCPSVFLPLSLIQNLEPGETFSFIANFFSKLKTCQLMRRTHSTWQQIVAISSSALPSSMYQDLNRP